MTFYDELATKSINSRLVTHFVLHGSNVIFILTGDHVTRKKKLAFTEISTLTHNKRYDTYWYPIFK